MDFQFFEPWHQVLPREAGHVVVFCGGEGRAELRRTACGIWRGEELPVTEAAGNDPDPGPGVIAAWDGGPRPERGNAWPRRASLCVFSASVADVGSRLDAVRAGRALPPGRQDWDLLDWDMLGDEILAAVAGLPDEAPLVLALDGLREQPDSIGLFGFVGRMMADPRLPIVLFVGVGEGGTDVRAACRVGD